MAKGMPFVEWYIGMVVELEKGYISAVDAVECLALNWGGTVIRIPKVVDLEKEMRECPEMLARFLAKLLKKMGKK